MVKTTARKAVNSDFVGGTLHLEEPVSLQKLRLEEP